MAPVQIVRDGYGWSAFIAGVPVAADGATYAEALIELVDALREYATDWNHHLRHAANHKDNRAFVELVSLSDDDQLKEWLASAAARNESISGNYPLTRGPGA